MSDLDADIPTLHIRCGSDIRESLGTAGFGGNCLEYSDPICEGPVPDTPDFIGVRAEYLAARYGSALDLTESKIATNLREAEAGLAEANRYGRVVLWFEHDSHDQLILARCLSLLAEHALPESLELICIGSHPDVARFLGLGQLGPAALAALWLQRRAVTPEQIALGQAIWRALRQPDPTGVQAVAETGTPALPLAAPALWRHLRELPGATDGLSLTHRLVLTILAEGPLTIGRIFGAMVKQREPLPFMGDLGLLKTVEAMARTTPPALTLDADEKPFGRTAAITETGRRVLARAADYLSLNPDERWVGGVIADGRWRWDETVRNCVPITG
jgi:Domain of unknown function (DUF1835)